MTVGRIVACCMVLSGAPSELGAEAFVKGGIDLRDSPQSDWDFADRWLGAVGYDWSVAPSAFLGFEVQSGYQTFAIGGRIQARVVPLNLFFNGRVGAHRGELRPYGGAGAGLMSQLDWERVHFFPEVVEVFEYHRDAGVHVFAGVRIGGHGLVEYMAQRPVGETTLVGPNFRWSHLLWGGVTW